MQPAHELADLLERECELGLGRVDQLRHLGRVGLEAALDQVEMERDGHEPLLGAVVQVALDTAPLGVAGGDDPRPGVGQIPHRATQLGDVAHDGDHFVRPGRSRSHLELALVAQVGAKRVLDRGEPALLERRADALHQALGDVRGQELVRGRADDLGRRVCELRRVAADLEVGAVGPQAQEQVG